MHASGPYQVPNYRALTRAVHTNIVPAGAFRGFGVRQAAIAQEQLYDDFADRVGTDRLEFRILNALDNHTPTVTGQILGEGVGIRACFEACARNGRRHAHKQRNSMRMPKARFVAVSESLGCPGPLGPEVFLDFYGARIKNENPSTLQMTLPGESGVAFTFPARTRSNATTNLGSTSGDATGMLCAPNTSFTNGASAASRRIDAA